MKKPWCNYCDPKFFVIYGFCDNCKRRCAPPLFDPNSDISIQEYDEFRSKWNSERPDMIKDILRREKHDT